jgi:hypothetical protein
VVGILLGVALLVAAEPTAALRSHAGGSRHLIRRTPQ